MFRCVHVIEARVFWELPFQRPPTNTACMRCRHGKQQSCCRGRTAGCCQELVQVSFQTEGNRARFLLSYTHKRSTHKRSTHKRSTHKRSTHTHTHKHTYTHTHTHTYTPFYYISMLESKTLENQDSSFSVNYVSASFTAERVKVRPSSGSCSHSHTEHTHLPILSHKHTHTFRRTL
jgi:hypothetical protein